MGAVPNESTVVLDGKEVSGVWMNLKPSRLINFSSDSISDQERIEIMTERSIMAGLSEMAFLIEKPQKEVPLSRIPHLTTDKETCPEVGDEIKATVFCDKTPSTLGEIAEEVIVSGPAGQDEFEITVFLSPSEGLSVKGEASKTLHVYRSKGKSESVTFSVIVDKKPEGIEVELNAYFFYRGQPCGRVTRILSTMATIEPVQRAGKLATAEATPADLTVTVTRKAGTAGAYNVALFSPHEDSRLLGESKLWDLGQDSQTFIKSLFAAFIAKQADPTVRIAELKGAGIDLFTRAPKNFQDAYQRLVAAKKLNTILVVSEEPFIPWELMVPPATLEERAEGKIKDPLGVTHAIGRWVTSENTTPFYSRRTAARFAGAGRTRFPSPAGFRRTKAANPHCKAGQFPRLS